MITVQRQPADKQSPDDIVYSSLTDLESQIHSGRQAINAAADVYVKSVKLIETDFKSPCDLAKVEEATKEYKGKVVSFRLYMSTQSSLDEYVELTVEVPK